MKRLAIILAALVACKSGAHSARPGTSGGAPAVGAATPRAAVDSFLAAVRAQDLQAMSVIWGTEKGPARDALDRAELEKRELIMQCFLAHDRFAVLADSKATGSEGSEDKHALQVALTKGQLTRQTSFTTVRGRGNRWFVEDVALEPVKDLCRGGPPSIR